MQRTNAEIQLPPAITAAGPTACAAWARFVADERFRPSTRSIYRGRALQFLRWLETQDLELGQVTPAEVERFLDGLNVGSDHSRMTYRTALRRFFDALVSYGAIPGNPADPAEQGTSILLATALPNPVQPETGEQPPTLADLKSFLHELDNTNEESEYFRPGLVAMYPIVIGGMDLSEIAAFTGIPLPEVELYAGRMRENGIWTPDEKILVDFDDPESPEAIVNLALIVGCAAGVFKRSAVPDAEDSKQPQQDTASRQHLESE